MSEREMDCVANCIPCLCYVIIHNVRVTVLGHRITILGNMITKARYAWGEMFLI